MSSVSYGNALIVYIARMNDKNSRMKFELSMVEIIGKLLGAKDLNLTKETSSKTNTATKKDFKNAGFKVK